MNTKATPNLSNALPFWVSLVFIPLWLFSVTMGGWWIALVPLYSTGITSVMDRFFGLSRENLSPDAEDSACSGTG